MFALHSIPTLLLLLVSADSTALQTQAASVSRESWQDINVTAGGHLHQGFPLSLQCFTTYDGEASQRNDTSCFIVEQNYSNPEFRVNRFGAYMNPQWETCQRKSEQCLLDNDDPSDPQAWTDFGCFQGSVPPYYIDIATTEDVQAAYNFSKSTGVHLVIKNSGHDYKGRSSSRGALALWTHKLKSISYNPEFEPEGCLNTRFPAMTLGAGVSWLEAFEFAENNNITIIGGYHQTVGASGGWLMGGGHSVLSPVYGLGVDRVLQIKIATPDGEYRVANECQNQDLFWALRGGGGGTFGVVFESTHLVEPHAIPLQVASVSFTATQKNRESWAKVLVGSAYQWGIEGWGGHIQTSSFIMVNPLFTLEEANNSMAEVAKYVDEEGGSVVLETLPSWYTFFVKYVLAAEAGVGVEILLASRLMPASLFQTEEGRSNLTNVLVKINTTAYIVVGTPFLYNETKGATSINPAWYDSLWHMGHSSTFSFNSTPEEKEAAYVNGDETVALFREIAPDTGSYFNEGLVKEPDWKRSYWGANHDRLLSVKRRYDPMNLLNCWQCVGWSGAADSLYSCYIDV